MERNLATVAPTGTVTFLFSDVVGSTRLWAADSIAMAASLEVHDTILERVITEHDGYIFATAGDSFGAAFARAGSAVECALALQVALAQADWGGGPALHVRFGLHVGEASERNGNYFGSAVNQAQRVMAVAHGDQCVLTDGVRDAAGIATKDLGTHILRDIEDPVHLSQLGTEEFPALWSIGVGIVALPLPRTTLIGRDEAVDTVRRLIGANRLVSLVGVGGCGKTRLAIEVAYREVPTHPDGVWFVDLSTITDEIALPGAFAGALQLSVGADAVATDQIIGYLAPRDALLVVDNCEHVVDISAEFIDVLIDRAPRLRVLVTSRESLVVDGEYTWKVPSLETGDASPARQLFVERAAAAGASLTLDDSELTSIDDIVERLDGIPLAIELAAARCRSMSANQILELLDDRFTLLSGGSRRLRQRQATLEGAVQWSYDLLEDDEKSMLRTLSTFQGGFSVADVAEVAGVSVAAARNLVDALTAKSLVDLTRDSTGAIRLRLLETIRLFALSRLIDAGEAIAVRDRHLDHFEGLPGVHSFETWSGLEWTLTTGREYENLRSAITWALERGRTDSAIRLAAAGAEAAASRGETDLAITILRTPAELSDRDAVFSRTMLAWLLMTVGRHDEAATILEPAIALNDAQPQDFGPFLLEVLGTQVAFSSGNVAALVYYERARNQALRAGGPYGIAGAEVFVSSAQSGLMRHSEALETLDAAIARAPGYGFFHLLQALRAWTLIRLGEIDAARSQVAEFVVPPAGSQWAAANVFIEHILRAHVASPEVAAGSLTAATREMLLRRPALIGDVLVCYAYLADRRGEVDRARVLLDNSFGLALGVVSAHLNASWAGGYPRDRRRAPG